MEIPPIFIPSKGRWGRRRATWRLLAAEGIPFTLVVEPAELTEYARATRGVAGGAAVGLPLNGQGICYARNHILLRLSPPDGWFWVIDDDILGFTAVRRASKELASVSIRTALRIASPGDAVGRDPKTCVVGMEYAQFLFRLAPRGKLYTTNSYANICVCLNRGLFPAGGIRYRFPIREDYDLCMQVIAHGGVVFRYQCVGFTAPGMGATKGGMTEFYESQKGLIRECNRLMVRLWGDRICQEVIKGKPPKERFDLKIYWQRLGKAAEEAGADGRDYMAVMGQPGVEEVMRLVMKPGEG